MLLGREGPQETGACFRPEGELRGCITGWYKVDKDVDEL